MVNKYKGIENHLYKIVDIYPLIYTLYINLLNIHLIGVHFLNFLFILNSLLKALKFDDKFPI